MGCCASEHLDQLNTLRQVYGVELKQVPTGVELLNVHSTICCDLLHGQTSEATRAIIRHLQKHTRFSEKRILELYFFFFHLTSFPFNTPKLTAQKFFQHLELPAELIGFLCQGLEDLPEHIPFPVMVQIGSIFSHGEPEDKLAYLFNIIDQDGNKTLSKDEVQLVVRACMSSTGLAEPHPRTVAHAVEQIFQVTDANGNEELDFDEFIENADAITSALKMSEAIKCATPKKPPTTLQRFFSLRRQNTATGGTSVETGPSAVAAPSFDIRLTARSLGRSSIMSAASSARSGDSGSVRRFSVESLSTLSIPDTLQPLSSSRLMRAISFLSENPN
eukprot:NODE_2911_length_1065_cov_21.676972_g2777_i0.p1 GENE.NODE_2911_length_1065_cov_21.676972_g2777_i0~~NODE_2911_length_1065_cov_21.676972_g2777_i0.p1  ORF type:complete len:332 (-),score=63.10 NODE_2911_length_1065_cov_21.676972_g2777_i0:4-999(-)